MGFQNFQHVIAVYHSCVNALVDGSPESDIFDGFFDYFLNKLSPFFKHFRNR